MIKFAIFDLEGTLLNSSGMLQKLGIRYLSYLGKEPKAGLSEALNELFLPERVDKTSTLARFLHEQYDIAYSAEEIARHLTRMTEAFYTDEVDLKDGAAKLLASLRAHCVHMSLVTVGDELLGMKALARLSLADFFAGAVSCSNYGSKMSPDVFLAAADLIYALPEETIVFENSLHAVRTAQKAGFATAAVADASESDQKGLMRAADLYAENIGDFADNIKEILGFEPKNR